VGNEAAARKAYRDAYLEIRQWQKEHDLSFDQIFLASGTGMTQGGLLAGQMEFAGEDEKKEEIIGISVARDQAAGTAAVARYAGIGDGSLCGREEPEIHFLDGYRCGGYGCFDARIEEVIRSMMENHGIALDPTYTGKAYAGMLDWLETHGTGQENVLFLHTGGMPLYFDYQACRRV
jgi:D-cysteine desulfhydrase